MTRPSIPRRFLAKVGVAVVAIGIAFGLCELGARMIFPRPPLASREPQIAFLYDPEIRYVIAPSQQGWIDDGLVSINALGFRGAEVALPKPPGRFRVVVVGDSLTLGWSVADEETFSARLERLLHDRFPKQDLDLLNLGVSGYNTRQEVTLVARHVSQLEPDLVLVGFYSNDVPDAFHDDEPTAGGTRVVTGGRKTGEVMYMNPTPTDWWNRQLRKSRAVYIAGRAFNRVRRAGEWGSASFAMEIDLLEGKSSPKLDLGWERVATQFERLRALADARSFSVGIVVLPSKDQVLGQYANASFQKKVRSLATPLRFDVIDPLPLMSEHRTRELFIPYDRNHPSAVGHALIAQAIAQYLDGHQLVAPAPRR
jgi:lysophospholipase L1-like esterase